MGKDKIRWENRAGQPGGKGRPQALGRGNSRGRAGRQGCWSQTYGRLGQSVKGGACQSWLFQLGISNVEVAHILVGALESPGDILIHRAVIKVQALQESERRHQYPESWGPSLQSTPG